MSVGGDKKDETTQPSPPFLPSPTRSRSATSPTWWCWPGSARARCSSCRRTRRSWAAGPTVGVRLNDEGVSREHCAFVRDGDKMVVEDMGSTNGTFCNGIKVDRRELADGDKIMVGSSTILKFTLPRLSGRGVPAPDVRIGAARRPDQGLQQEVLHRLPGEGVRVRGAPRRPAGADLPGHRLLQEDQRHARPPGRGLRARRAVADDGRRCCARRTCWRASAARSSRSCAAARTCRARRSSPSASARRSRSASSRSAARTSR